MAAAVALSTARRVLVIVIVMCLCLPAAMGLQLTIAVDPSNVSDHVSDHMYGSGIETYNHCMYGGLWSGRY